MRRMLLAAVGGVLLCGSGISWGTLPQPNKEWVDFPVSYDADAPGVFAADQFLDKPAGKDGGIIARNGHFYSGGKRVRFLGVNFCFGANFPTHAEADVVAARLARFGINMVRFHHMDTQPFPGGIFTRGTEELNKEALDRMDYLIAALKKNGVYADLNLHVSHSFARALGLPGAEKAPTADKIIDLFDPALIAAEKNYARALLTHVNAYTGKAYIEEPAVGIVEINNENTFFTWGGPKMVEELPGPFVAELNGLWNQWLKEKYGSREKLAAAWNVGLEPAGANLLKDPAMATAGRPGSAWNLEKHETAEASVAPAEKGVRVSVTKLSGSPWHVQLGQGKLAVKKDRQYTLKFRIEAEGDGAERKIGVGVSQAHDPWENLGLAATVAVQRTVRDVTLYFAASADDDNGRVVFSLGDKVGDVVIGNVTLTPGGQEGLGTGEDFSGAKGTVRSESADTPMTGPRHRDWFAFLQAEDERYFSGMYRYLKEELNVQAPVTGTIGLGALGTMSQAGMDYVDAHGYWQHPRFPGKSWDGRNYLIPNTPMVDSPTFGTLPGIAAIRVAGKPFTVTEYNHPAPSDWREECVPLLATTAAMQDWDGVFLFAYSHVEGYERDHVNSFFDIEGDPARMLLMPAAARIFLSGAVRPLPEGAPVMVSEAESLANADRYFYNLWPQLEALHGLTREVILRRQLAISFPPRGVVGDAIAAEDRRLSWTTGEKKDAGVGQFVLNDAHAAVFVGFPKEGQEIALGPVTLTEVRSPFVVATLTAVDPAETLGKAAHLLLTVGARVENHEMGWNADRTSVSDKWGKGPTRIEPVHARVKMPAGYVLVAMDSAGKELKEAADLAESGTMWYRIDRR